MCDVKKVHVNIYLLIEKSYVKILIFNFLAVEHIPHADKGGKSPVGARGSIESIIKYIPWLPVGRKKSRGSI